MTTSTTTSAPTTDAQTGSRNWRHTTGVVLSVLLGAFLAFDIVGKLTQPESVIEGTAELGFPIDQTYVMAIALAACLVAYAIPRTAVLGAIGLTAYFGGAVTAHMRVEDPLLDHTLFPVYFGILVWAALALRRPELLKVAGIRR
ncbi:DoxX family protein [Gordonia sp. PKS22-38]|uniref:DoxX family protein n=1 Tax=Gordonia prachuapensis TaxID=3115651 RepID=A0ABU7MYX1_9ACTN|nr:DoxX family protein [Gordonia sp. PKS22-38]